MCDRAFLALESTKWLSNFRPSIDPCRLRSLIRIQDIDIQIALNYAVTCRLFCVRYVIFDP